MIKLLKLNEFNWLDMLFAYLNLIKVFKQNPEKLKM